MAACAPFLARCRDSGEVLVVLGFTDGPSPRAICAGVGLGTHDLHDLEVVRAAADWPRPYQDTEEVDRIFGPRTQTNGASARPPSALVIDRRPASAG